MLLVYKRSNLVLASDHQKTSFFCEKSKTVIYEYDEGITKLLHIINFQGRWRLLVSKILVLQLILETN